ncbi:superinfection immunity protein [Rufibacter glacialis]|nr:superinfection immunity protein [Rufibacter glacialis]
MSNLGIGEALIILGVLLCFYFLPSVVGVRKRNFWAIFAVNLFFGWSFIGWVIAFVWACSSDAMPVQVVHVGEKPHKSLASELESLRDLKELGLLTDDEFSKAKEKLLA